MAANINKKNKMLKKCLSGALVLTLIFSFNNYAAVVSDNDGSAFITKAEFDSLKNSFQSQIDNYNQGIDSKIDSAIASYLAGMTVSTTTTRSLFLTDDDGYWFFGYRPEQTYDVPGLDFIYTMHGAGHNTIWNQYPSCYGCTLIAKSTAKTMTKNLVTLDSGKEQYYKDYTKNKWLWSGVNNSWKENIQFGIQTYLTSTDVPNAYRMTGMSIYNAYDLSVTSGYHADISTLWKTFVNNNLYYQRNPDGDTLLSPTKRNGYLEWSANYDSSSTKKKVVCSIKNADWNVVCNSLTNTWNNDDEQTIVGTDIETNASSTYDGNLLKATFNQSCDEDVTYTGLTVRIEGHYNPGTLSGGVYSRSVSGVASTTKVPSVCSLGYIPSKELYLFTTKKTFSSGTKTGEIENIKLTDGIPLFYVAKDTEVKWKVKVNSVSGGIGSGVASTDEVDIALGYGTFSNTGYANTSGYVDSTNISKKSSDIKWFTTSGKTATISFKTTEDVWIYLKAKPHSLTQAEAEASRVWNINFSTSGDYGTVAFVNAS